MSQPDREAAATIGLAMIIRKCVEGGGEKSHPSAMIGLYFGLVADRVAPDFAAALRGAFERTWAEATGAPPEAVEAQFMGPIGQMADAFRRVP